MSKKHKDAKEKKHKAAKPAAVSEKKSKPAVPAKQAAVAPLAAPEAAAVERSNGSGDRQITLISKALADPKRMSILRAIAKGGATCADLRTCSSISAATLSHHMKELESAGLIETERSGRFVHATLRRKAWKSYLDELKAFLK